MLPRVGAVLAQFIAPIATSSASQLPREKSSSDDDQPPSKRPPPEPKPQDQAERPAEAEIIPFPLSASSQKDGKNDAEAHAPLPAGVTSSLLQLLHLLREQQVSIMRWLGISAYQTAARQQKRNGRGRKGAMLDQKAE